LTAYAQPPQTPQSPPSQQPTPAAPAASPGYPAYPQGSGYPYGSYWPNNAYGGYAYPYGYGYGYPYGYYYPVYVRRRRAPGETYALVVSWIVTVFGGLSILCGLLMALLVALATSAGPLDNLTEQTVFTGITLGPLVGGGFAIYYGIRGILRHPSPRFSLPNPLIFVVLTALTLAGGVALWHANAAPGPALAVLPLAIASGLLPALAIFSLTTWRLRMPTTRRHVWMSFFYGLTLAPLLAIIFELVAAIFFTQLLTSFGVPVPVGSGVTNPSTANPNDPVGIVLLLLSLSVAAPLVEEGVKPLGAVLLMRRLRTPASAFLMGLAAGIGFDMFETIGYIGQGEADWVGIAIERIGAGLLHGVGAGMAALGWYYLINGKGVRLRWLRGVGGIVYAVLQHAIFNGSNLLNLVPGPIGQWMQQPLYVGRLPLDGGVLLFFGYYVVILGVLIYVTGRLAQPREIALEPPLGGPGLPSADTVPAGREHVRTVGSGTR
jgi:RsiW-degrading membrane proteinase PrsW (M82 family)